MIAHGQQRNNAGAGYDFCCATLNGRLQLRRKIEKVATANETLCIMNLEDFGNFGETISGIAVVASLIYLIFEVRRNTRSVRTKPAWDATNSLAE